VTVSVIASEPIQQEFEVEHSFPSGTLSIWVDSKLAFNRSLEGINKKHLVEFHRLEGHEFYSCFPSS
jgi:hypothetical protein